MSYLRRPATVAVVTVAAVLCAGTASAGSTLTSETWTTQTLLSGPTQFADCPTTDPTPFGPNTETEAMSAVNPTDPRNIATIWQQDRYLSGSSRGITVAVTRDAGLSWTRVPVPGLSCPTTGGRTTNPWLSFDADGTLYATATISGAESRIQAATSTDGGLTWSAPTTLLAGPRWQIFNDKQTTTGDRTDPDRTYAVWNRRTNAENRHDIMFTRTTDGGQTWEPARSIYAPPSPAATSGSQLVQLRDGTLLNVFFQNDLPIGTPPGPTPTDHVLAIRSTDGGDTWSAPVTIADLRLNIPVIPGTSTILIAPGLVPDVAVDPLTGAVHAVWGDGTLSTSGSAVGFASSLDGGRTWTPPRQVGRTPASPPGGIGQAFLPQVEVSRTGTVAVSFLDLRNDRPEPGADTDAWLATCWGPYCADPASRWEERHLTGPFDFATAVQSFGGPFIGTYVGLTHRPGFFLATGVRTTGDPANPQDVYLVATPATPWTW